MFVPQSGTRVEVYDHGYLREWVFGFESKYVMIIKRSSTKIQMKDRVVGRELMVFHWI